MRNESLVNDLTMYLSGALNTKQIGKDLESMQSRIDCLRAKISDFSSKDNIDIITKLEMKNIVSQMEHTHQRLDEIKNHSEELRTRVCNIEKGFRDRKVLK